MMAIIFYDAWCSRPTLLMAVANGTRAQKPRFLRAHGLAEVPNFRKKRQSLRGPGRLSAHRKRPARL